MGHFKEIVTLGNIDELPDDLDIQYVNPRKNQSIDPLTRYFIYSEFLLTKKINIEGTTIQHVFAKKEEEEDVVEAIKKSPHSPSLGPEGAFMECCIL